MSNENDNGFSDVEKGELRSDLKYIKDKLDKLDDNSAEKDDLQEVEQKLDKKIKKVENLEDKAEDAKEKADKHERWFYYIGAKIIALITGFIGWAWPKIASFIGKVS